ncbi:MAG: hypothetical protein U0470_12395 [Anaerolineae bacterium]
MFLPAHGIPTPVIHDTWRVPGRTAKELNAVFRSVDGSTSATGVTPPSGRLTMTSLGVPPWAIVWTTSGMPKAARSAGVRLSNVGTDVVSSEVTVVMSSAAKCSLPSGIGKRVVLYWKRPVGSVTASPTVRPVASRFTVAMKYCVGCPCCCGAATTAVPSRSPVQYGRAKNVIVCMSYARFWPFVVSRT